MTTRTAIERGLLALLAALHLTACGNGRQATTPVDASPTRDLDAALPRICDDSEEVRLAIRIEGGGPAAAGMTMLAENGWRFMLVDGRCHAWLLSSHTEPLRELTLSPAQEVALAAALELPNWQALAGPHGGGCPDAPGITYRFGTERVQGSICGLAATDSLKRVNDMFVAQLELLSAAASPVSGDVRYLVLVEASRNDSRPGIEWPLTISIESVVVLRGDEFNYRPGNSRQATGADAERLRGIRSSGAGTGPVYDFTRVLGSDGTTYQLFVRDAVPGEQADGLFPSGTF